MPLTERSSSLNTYAFPKIWYKAHMMEYRAMDVNFCDKQARKWLFADLLEKPADLVKYRKKEEGGLGLHHIKCKSLAILIKTFIETSCHKDFQHSVYHQGLLLWNVYDDRQIPNPSKTPYYSQEFFNLIKCAVNKNLVIESMSSKDWYEFILSSVLHQPGDDALVPCRAEIANQENDWQKTWSLSRTKGLGSESLSFLWTLLHGLLPTRDRLFRILPTVTSAECQLCETGQQDSVKHALALCPATKPVFDWMFEGLRRFSVSLTVDKLLLLDIELDNVLPHDHLPLVWFTAEVWRRLWKRRRDGKQCRLYDIRSEVEAEINLARRTKYGDMAVVLEAML